MGRRVVRQTRHKVPTDRKWKRTRQGAVAICTDSSTGIRGVRTARCKVAVNADIAYRTALWRSAADCSLCTYRGNIGYTSDGAVCSAPDTSHLFSVLPFPPLPILWNATFLNLHYCAVPLYTPMLRVTFHLHLQFVLSAVCLSTSNRNCFSGNKLAFIYLYPEQNGPLLAVSVIQHTHSQQPTIRSYCVLCARQTIINSLLRHYGLTLYYLLQCWFSIRKRTGFAGNV